MVILLLPPLGFLHCPVSPVADGITVHYVVTVGGQAVKLGDILGFQLMALQCCSNRRVREHCELEL